jgi:hypothetical protein
MRNKKIYIGFERGIFVERGTYRKLEEVGHSIEK